MEMMIARLTKVLAFGVWLWAIVPATGEYVAFSINGPGDPTEAGYDFDDPTGPFNGIWIAEEDTTNGHSMVLTPDAYHSGWSLSPTIDVPWRSSRASIDSAGIDWNHREWVTNFIGTVTELSSGAWVTAFFLYDPWCDEVAVTIEGTHVATLITANEAVIPTRLQRYGWQTNDVPRSARIFGCVVQLQDANLDFVLTPITASTSPAPVRVYGIVVDTQNDSRIDNDGDGVVDLEEHVAGTNPFDAESSLRITGVSAQSNECSLCWTSESNRLYRIIERTNMLQVTGTILVSGIAATPSMNCATVMTSDADAVFLAVEATEK